MKDEQGAKRVRLRSAVQRGPQISRVDNRPGDYNKLNTMLMPKMICGDIALSRNLGPNSLLLW